MIYFLEFVHREFYWCQEALVRIGLFLRNLDEEFQITIFRSVRDRAMVRGVDLVCVQGETVRGPRQEEDDPFGLARSVRFDGILVLSSVIIDHNEHATEGYLSRLLPQVPCISVGRWMNGQVSVSIKNSRSMRRIMEHLILDHGYRRFLFIGGPRGHRDTKDRERVFRQVIQVFRPSHPDIECEVEYGGFSELSAIEIVRRHLDDRPYHAIVAANDNMALGVIKDCKLQNDPAWRECAVTGFDDIPNAEFSLPPLTTVHQPLEEMGARSVDRLIELIEERDSPIHATIESWPVIRESCGCARAGEPLPGPGYDQDPHLKASLLNVQHRVWESERGLQESRALGRDMSAVSNQARLIYLLDRYLLNIGARCFFLILFPEKEDRLIPAKGDLIYERVDRRESPLPARGGEIDLEDFFSTYFRAQASPWNLCLSHLLSGSEQLGIAIYQVEDWALIQLVTSLPHVASAVKRLRVLASQADRNRRLETIVEERTRDLIAANKSLTEEIERRRQTEGEVLQVSEFERRRFGLDLHDDICQRLAGIVMYLRSYRIKTLDESRNLIEEAANLVDETLALTRQYAHVSFPMDFEKKGLDSVLGSLCETTAVQYGCVCRYESELAELDPPPKTHDALNIYRIVQEALHNAAQHARASQLRVSVKVCADSCVVEVADNGMGFKKSPEVEQGLGLRSMAYRASQLGGKMRFETANGQGTSVTLEIPRAAISRRA